MKTLTDIETRMAELETLIKDAKGRVPAHSARPEIMMELMDYEDEYEALMTRRADLKGETP
jgi:hypothetical protein